MVLQRLVEAREGRGGVFEGAGKGGCRFALASASG
jgi:hypothetical protein